MNPSGLHRIATAVDLATDAAWAEASPGGLLDRRAVPALRQAVAELRALAAAIGPPVVVRYRYAAALWVYGRQVPELGEPAESQALFALPPAMLGEPAADAFAPHDAILADPDLAAFTAAPGAEPARMPLPDLLQPVQRNPFGAWPLLG